MPTARRVSDTAGFSSRFAHGQYPSYQRVLDFMEKIMGNPKFQESLTPASRIVHVSMNDRLRMLRPAPYAFDGQPPEFDRWYHEDKTPRARPLDADELARYLVSHRGMPIKAARLAVKEKSLAAKDDKALWLQVGHNPLVERVLQAMQHEVETNGLELMQRYPNDLLIHDRNHLMIHAVPGASFGWTVSDSSTHLTTLGVHAEYNKAVGYHLNLSSNQRFYEIKIARDAFSIIELSREQYAALERRAIPYRKAGGKLGFSVCRGAETVGAVELQDIGNWHERKYSVGITPAKNCTALDLVALDAYAHQAPIEAAQTLFVRTEVTWKPAAAMQMAA